MIESNDVRISDLFAGVGGCRMVGGTDVSVTSLCYRSDLCQHGSLFFCVPGLKVDGHDFAADAVSRGAVALCVERPVDAAVSQAVVPCVRRVMGTVASRHYGHPSADLVTVGITGTNGKTTSAFLMAHILDAAGLRSGLLGTVERRVGGRLLPAGRTTPEAPDIQSDLAAMRDSGDKAAVMEVSSHALDQSRVSGVEFDAVAFTNLTQDHLDYHGDLESYFLAKQRLFLDAEYRRSDPAQVVNVDDAFGRRLASACEPSSLLTFTTSGDPWEGGEADLELSDFQMGPSGTRGTLVLRGNAVRKHNGWEGAEDAAPSGPVALPFASTLVGEFNVANALTALGLGIGLGLEPASMLVAIESFAGVPGRMERVEGPQGFAVFVDYAHTPDSVENVLATAQAVAEGRLIAVLGCGGDRDRGKRPLMARVAEDLADIVVVTSDNPRSEDPMAIIADMLAGVRDPRAVAVEQDRRQAIRSAIQRALPGDVVMILGKGHESGQEFADGTVPFDDREVARAALAELEGVAS